MKKVILLTTAILLVFSINVFCYDEALLVGRTPFAYEKLTVGTGAVVQLTAAYRNLAGAVFITVEDNNMRFRIDGGNPDANDGHLVVATSYQNLWLYDPFSIRNLRMIGIGGNSTVLVTYYRRN